MRERPIIFSTQMVWAILDDRKTQTRRVVREDLSEWSGDVDDDGVPLVPHPKTGCLTRIATPYGVPGDRLWVRETFWGSSPENVVYKADDPDVMDYESTRWSPSIFMPRWASRIDLEVTDVRVVRLQAITEEDAIAEGVRPAVHPPAPSEHRHAFAFAQLWDEINGKRASWASNPWVRRIAFKRIVKSPRMAP